jgi:hypothetical protein
MVLEAEKSKSMALAYARLLVYYSGKVEQAGTWRRNKT